MTAQLVLPQHVNPKDIPTLTDIIKPSATDVISPIPTLTDVVDDTVLVSKPTRLQTLKGVLKGAFTKKAVVGYLKENWDTMLATTAASASLKVAVFACSASFATSTAGIVGLAAASGALSAAVRHGYKLSKAEKGEARDKLRLTNKEFAQKLLTGAAMGGLFSSFGVGLGHLWVTLRETCGGGPHGLTSFITQHHANPAPVVANATPAASVHASTIATPNTTAPAADSLASHAPAAETHAVAAPANDVTAHTSAPDVTTLVSAPKMTSPLSAIQEYAKNHDVSAKLKDALLRAESTNPRIRAQAFDDIGVYAPKSLQVQAHELLQKAAAMGNLKAKADLITMEFYGNKSLGIKSNPEAAIDKIVELSKKSQYAAKLVKEWVGRPYDPTDIQVDTPVVADVVPSTPDVSVAPVVPEAPAPSVVETFNASTEAVLPPVAAPAPVEAAIPVAKPYIAPDCKVRIDITDSQKATMICEDNGAELPQPGEKVTIQRPALLGALSPR